MSEEKVTVTKQKTEVPVRRNASKKIDIPKRVPSVVVPKKIPIYTTPDKTTCVECPCFPPEDPYVVNKKLNPCLQSPKTLYELTSKVVDSLKFPEAFNWSVEDVAKWLADNVGFPQYEECILNNNINGRRLLLLEHPSKLADINIKDFEHIQTISSKIRKLFSTEVIRFARSIGLPFRKPSTFCTIFKSRTGPTWGLRTNWTRSDILRWMKIIMPEPQEMNHWDLVWYQKPDYPKVKFGRIRRNLPSAENYIPRYTPKPEVCKEYMTPRKFILQKDIPRDKQFIWMEEYTQPETKAEPVLKKPVIKKSRLIPEKVSLTGLTGKDFILAKRKMPQPKFFR